MKKNARCTVKKPVALMLFAICIFTVCIAFIGCQNNETYTDDDYDYDYSYKLTKSDAISAAKESSEVQKEIATEYGMKFFYTPDWGTVTATEQSDGSWKVVLKGTISGYTDDYKTDFEYDKKFTATVTVSGTGYVEYVIVTKY